MSLRKHSSWLQVRISAKLKLLRRAGTKTPFLTAGLHKEAQKLLLKSNSEKPNKADTLNYLGFTTRKLGDYENGEKYYLQGLEIDPNHVGINEYLGELYVATNRLNLAKERLKILENYL